MLPASSVEAFLEAPEGRYFLGRRHLVFQATETVYGHASWGEPDLDDVRECVRLCEIGLRPSAQPHVWLVDLRFLESVTPLTFFPWVDYVRKHAEVLAQKIVRQGQLRPPGFVGAIITGFSQVAGLPYPERVFGGVDDAVAWLGLDRDFAYDLVAELGALRESALAVDPTIARLREELAHADRLTLDDAARRLAMSSRSLHRTLRARGTSFRAEQASTRARRAKELLLGDEPLPRIASELGFPSTAHFTTAFRRATGEPPSAFRHRHGRRASNRPERP